MNETAQTTFSVPSPGELEQLTELHKAMGDYTRMRILWYLMQKDSCVSELAQKMEVTESAISHQLRALRIVRLVQSRKAGKSVIYSLQDEHIRWILEETYQSYLLVVLAAPELRFQQHQNCCLGNSVLALLASQRKSL